MGAGLNPLDSATNIAIVNQPFTVEDHETPFGQRWGGEVFTLTDEHLTALEAGQTLALDVQNEYVAFVRMDKQADREAGRADGQRCRTRCADQAETGRAGV